MCLDDDCNDNSLTGDLFLRGATATVATLAGDWGTKRAAQTPPPPTRVLDDPKIQHGRVMFKHNGNGLNWWLPGPSKAEGVYRECCNRGK
jgi:hypothetical protein